jgi:hypothetical protein
MRFLRLVRAGEHLPDTVAGLRFVGFAGLMLERAANLTGA